MVAASDILSQLPVETIQEILMRLSPEDLGKARKCCKTWRKLTSTKYFCKSKLSFNWRNGIFSRSIVSLPSKITNLIYLDDKILIVGVEPDNILIVNISNGMIEKSIVTGGWWCIETCEDKLFAICYANIRRKIRLVFRVWSLQTYEEILNMKTDMSFVFSYSFSKHLFACTSYENHYPMLYIFNIETGKLDYRKDGVTAVFCSNDITAMVTSPGLIEIIDLNYNLLMAIDDCCNDDEEVTGIEMKNEYLIAIYKSRKSFEKSHTICIWNIKTKVKLWTIKELPFGVLTTFFNENILIWESYYESFLVLNVLTGKRKVLMEISAGDRYYFMSNNRFIFLTNRKTSRMELWCLRTQNLINSFDLKMLYSDVVFNSANPCIRIVYKLNPPV